MIPDTDDELGAWALAKWHHAIDLRNDLKSRVDAWFDSEPYRVESVISEDRYRFQAFLRIDSPPPLTEWALLLGDCLHNIRSALDAAVWELAHHGGGQPADARKVQFPFCDSEASWLRRRRNLAGLPEDLLDRIGNVQPFTHATGDSLSALSALNHLDIEDKHKVGISANLRPREARSTTQIRFESDEAARRHVRPKQKIRLEMVDGELIHDEPTKDPIVEVRGEFDSTIVLVVETPKGPQIIWAVLESIFTSAGNVLDHLYDLEFSR